jgi:hypothetical protein
VEQYDPLDDSGYGRGGPITKIFRATSTGFVLKGSIWSEWRTSTRCAASSKRPMSGARRRPRSTVSMPAHRLTGEVLGGPPQSLSRSLAEVTHNSSGAGMPWIRCIAWIVLYDDDVLDVARDHRAVLRDMARHDHAHVVRHCRRW